MRFFHSEGDRGSRKFAPSLHASRAETRLTVYRAHASRGSVGNMTPRAVLALRVIQRQGKSRSTGLVKILGSLVGKMKISQNL